jgi:uncharacterized membrane protein (UPF0127 family)
MLSGGLRLAEARTARARLLGLAGLDEPPPGHALLIPRCRSVHTFGMRFALDLVWLDAEGRVVAVTRGVPPRRMRSCRRGRAVVEVPAGGAAAALRALRGGRAGL